MLYKFKSKVTSDVIMLEPNGREILQIIGKFSSDHPHNGIIEPEDMPAALAALEAALVQAAQINAKPNDAPADSDAALPEQHTVQLHQRAAPFLDMLRRSLAARQAMVWGV